MALTIYPGINYDAFVSVADCDEIILLNIPSSQTVAYDALEESDKEIYIRQATTIIKQKITLPSTLEDDLEKATAYLVNHSVGLVMTNSDSSSNVKVKEIVDVIKTEYFTKGIKSNDLPDIVKNLLNQYDLISSNSLSIPRT